MSAYLRTHLRAKFSFALVFSACCAVSFTHAQTVPGQPTVPSSASASALLSAATPLTLSVAFRIAVSRQPWASARDEREREQLAREAVADSWLADVPTIGSGFKTGNRDGLREFEIEISAPIASPSRRSILLATARSESESYRANVEQEKLKLAGLVRDAYWAVQLAAVERDLASDEVQRSEQLAADSSRRTKAGESARVDTLQAQAAVQTTYSARIAAEQRHEATKQTLRALIGVRGASALADSEETRSTARASALDEHPSLKLAAKTVQLARAKLNEVLVLTNTAPSVSFTLANERTNSSASATTARIGVSVPFGGSQRATPRIAQANAELAESQATIQLTRQQLEADATTAEATVSSIERRIATLSERSRLATEVAELYAKAYRLGELDLPSRLRSEGERASANLALSRARIELKHALSRVNQSLGLLP
jgi:outer membrane protein, heavy metal efflux system